MPKKKVIVDDFIVIKITGPDCRLGDWLILPGETATVPADLAAEWIREQRAVTITAEVQDGDR